MNDLYQHVKTKGIYKLIGYGRMQAGYWGDHHPQMPLTSHGKSVDMREVAIYQSINDGSIWVRPREEFEDGRFKRLHD